MTVMETLSSLLLNKKERAHATPVSVPVSTEPLVINNVA
jgi:hypothetical protein